MTASDVDRSSKHFIYKRITLIDKIKTLEGRKCHEKPVFGNCTFEQNKCSGRCPLYKGSDNEFENCIETKPNPKSASDCGCASCEIMADKNNNLSCKGNCFESGLTCTMIKRPLYPSFPGIELVYVVCACVTPGRNTRL